MARKPKVGDVVRIATNKGFAYAQLSHMNKLCGCLLRIFEGFFPNCTSIPNVQELSEAYQTYVFPEDLFAKDCVQIIGNQPLRKEFIEHPLMRAGVRDPKTGKVADWWLWDGTQEWLVGPLTDEMRCLSLRQIWVYTILVNRIEAGWKPSDVV